MDLSSIGHEDGVVCFVDGDTVAVKLAEERERHVIARADDDTMDICNDSAVLKEYAAGDRIEDISERRCLHGETFERTNLSRNASSTGREQRCWKVKSASSRKLVNALRLCTEFTSDIRRRHTRSDQKDVLAASSSQCVSRLRALSTDHHGMLT